MSTHVPTLHRSTIAAARSQPWRNGGGSTRELLAWPQMPGHTNAWQVRVSVAHIAQDGPFSAFAGVDRCFAVLSGAGVLLHLDGTPLRLDAYSAPLAFAGEAAPQCVLTSGPTDDLNLMVRRGLGVAQMWRSAAQPYIEGSTRWRGVYAPEPAAVHIGEHVEHLAAHTLLWDDSADTTVWTVQGHSTALCLAVR